MRRREMNFFFIRIFFWGMLLFCMPAVVWADGDFFVDSEASLGGDGSSGKPFRKISQALGEVRKGDKIFIKNGVYEGGFVVKNGVHLQGESRSKVVVGGTVFLEDKSSLSKLTVSGGIISVKVEKDADATVENCDIKDSGKIGINIVPGNGKLIVKNSKIFNGDGKGFYVEKGNRVEISSSKVYDNKEEGIDLRDEIDGFILKNQIYDNGESGIEVILGSADLSIRDNAILGNGSSGIATQYYGIAPKPGGIKIEANEIKDSRKFGIDCNLPHGGNPGSGYWSKGLDVAKNDFDGNKMGRINSKCKLVEFDQGDGGDEYDEAKGMVVIETAAEKAEREKKEEIIAQEIKRIEEETQKKTEFLEGEFEKISRKHENAGNAAQNILVEIERQNKVWRWFRGISGSKLSVLADSKAKLDQSISDLELLGDEAEDSPVKIKIEELKNKAEQDRNFVSQKILLGKNKFSIWGLFGKLLKFG